MNRGTCNEIIYFVMEVERMIIYLRLTSYIHVTNIATYVEPFHLEIFPIY